jgi:hypothetical protein
MILRISVNLVKFCVSEVDEFWWNYFYFAWRKRGGGERGVVDGRGPLVVIGCIVRGWRKRDPFPDDPYFTWKCDGS